MRTEMTQPERELWIALRAKRLGDIKFSRQVVIGPFIADFVARSRRLIVEVDGDTHSDTAKDEKRTDWLNEQGYRVIRFGNSDVMQNLEGVLDIISAALGTAPLPTLSP
uniref:endonuclease domain-containing protein n=1 Tax=Sphingomonas bacterium TaxID=1895847 RepID=UPI0026238D9A